MLNSYPEHHSRTQRIKTKDLGCIELCLLAIINNGIKQIRSIGFQIMIKMIKD